MFYDQNKALTQAKGERDPEHTRTQRWWGRRQGSRPCGGNLNTSSSFIVKFVFCPVHENNLTDYDSNGTNYSNLLFRLNQKYIV